MLAQASLEEKWLRGRLDEIRRPACELLLGERAASNVTCCLEDH